MEVTMDIKARSVQIDVRNTGSIQQYMFAIEKRKTIMIVRDLDTMKIIHHSTTDPCDKKIVITERNGLEVFHVDVQQQKIFHNNHVKYILVKLYINFYEFLEIYLGGHGYIICAADSVNLLPINSLLF